MFVFSKELAKNNAQQLRVMKSNYDEVNKIRNSGKSGLTPELFVNMGSKPADLYREFDTQTVQQFRLDEGDAILNPLMGLARSIGIGRYVLEYSRSSDAGNFYQSMSGEVLSAADKVDYDTDSTIIPINVTTFKRPWREGEMFSQEQFDDSVIMQSEHVRTHRQGVISSFLDGHKDKDGNLLTYKGNSWAGVRSSAKVDQVDLGTLGYDFTSSDTTGAEFHAGFLALAQRRAVDNKVNMDAAYFVSNSIYWNMAREYSTAYNKGTILQDVLTVPGVGSITPSSVLTGNQVLSMVVSPQYLQPIVGMQVSTIAKSRPDWDSPLAFDIVSAIGWQIKTDFGSTNTAIQYAAS
jgi:hypothetical protein